MDFWTGLDRLLRDRKIVIDRPQGSTHPRFPRIQCPLDYGYLEATTGGDGREIDVWRGSANEPTLTEIVCAVDLMKGDAEIKLLVGCTEEEIGMVESFHNSWEHMAGKVVLRKDETQVVPNCASPKQSA